jgi:hypothetical protein
MKKLLALIMMAGSMFVLSLVSLGLPAVVLVFFLVTGGTPPSLSGQNIVTLLSVTLVAEALPQLALAETLILLVMLAL